MDAFDFVDNGVVFLFFSAVDKVGLRDSLHGPIRRNGEDVELVDLPEFARFRHRGTGHAADLIVEFEEVLKGDRR